MYIKAIKRVVVRISARRRIHELSVVIAAHFTLASERAKLRFIIQGAYGVPHSHSEALSLKPYANVGSQLPVQPKL